MINCYDDRSSQLLMCLCFDIMKGTLWLDIKKISFNYISLAYLWTIVLYYYFYLFSRDQDPLTWQMVQQDQKSSSSSDYDDAIQCRDIIVTLALGPKEKLGLG